MVVTVLPTNPPANAGANQAVCTDLATGRASATLIGNAPTVGTGTWARVGGTGNPAGIVLNQVGNVLNISNMLPGSHIFEWTLASPSCGSGGSLVTVFVNESNPNAAITTTPPSPDICADPISNLGAVTLTGNMPNSGSGTWTRIGGTGGTSSMSISVVGATLNATGLGVGTHTFEWCFASPCGNSAATYTVNIIRQNPPATATAAATQVCADAATLQGTVNLIGNPPVSGSGTWTRTAGPGTFTITNPNNPNTDVTGLAVGTHTFQWTLTNGACTSSSATVTVTVVRPNPAAIANAAQTSVCADAATDLGTVQLVGNAPVSGTGAWERTGGTGAFGAMTIIDPHNPTTNVTGLGVGTHTFRWVLANGVCGATQASVTVTIVRPNGAVTASAVAAVVCADIATNTGSVSLQGSPVVSGGGSWSRIAGAGSFNIANPNDPNTSVSGLSVGDHTFRWTVSNGACGGGSADVTVTVVRPNPAATASSPTPAICAIGGVATASLVGNAPMSGSGQWTRVSGPGTVAIADAASPSTTVSGLMAGTHIFRWTLTNGVCGSSSADVTISVTETNPPISAAATTVCADPITNVGKVTLQGSAVVSGAGTWTRVSGSGTFSIANPNNASTDVNGLAPGTHVFRWTVVNGVCGTSSADVTVNVAAPANAGPDQTLCQATTVTMAANSPINGRGAWRQINGTNPARIEDPANPRTTITGLRPGVYTFRWTITGNDCPETSDEVVIAISAPAVAGPAQTVCVGTEVRLAAEPAAVGAGRWTQVEGPAATINNPTSPNATLSNLAPGNYRFRWTITGGDCNPGSSDETTVTVVGITAADRQANVSDIEYSACANEIPANVTITVSPTRTGVRYELRNGSTVLASALGNNGAVRFTITAPTENRELTVVAIASANGVTCPEVELTDRAMITVRPCPPSPITDRPVIGVAKQALPAVRQVNGAFHIPIIITVRNYGNVPLTNIVVSDDMTNVFPAPARYSIVRQPTATGSLVANPQFDGTAAQPNLVIGGRLEVGESQTVTFVVSLIPNRATGPFFNTALAEGSHNTTRVRDISVDGQNPDPNFDGNPNETSPTIIQLPQPANRAPIAVDDLFTVQGCGENNGGNVLANDRDPDEDELAAAVVTNATTRRGGRISIAANGAISYTPPSGFTGTDEFAYEVCDRVTPPLCSRATITFNVTACPNRPTHAPDITLTTDNCTNIDQALEIPLVDADGDPVRVTIISDLVTPLRGIVSLSATGRITYRPALNAQGQERITYQVCDNRNPALCATGTIFINVFLCTNQPPVVPEPRRINTDNCTEIRGNALEGVTDPNGDRVSIRPVTGARSKNGGVFSIGADGAFIYTPPQGFTGQDEFTYIVCDNGNPLSKCTEGKVAVDVLACSQVFIPRGFSPNGDGVNDKFEILGAERYDIHLRIYNRWGNLVFEDKHYKNTWDGTAQGVGIVIGDKVPDGTYYFIVDLRDGGKPIVDFLTIQR